MRVAANGWTLNYTGGRLGDIHYGGKPVECVECREYDFATGEFGPEPTRSDLRRILREWDAEQGDCYRANVVAYL